MPDPSRRAFLRTTTAAVGSSTFAASLLTSTSTSPGKEWASERVRLGVIGAGGRAASLIETFAAHPAAEIVAIADLDANRLPEGLALAERLQNVRPSGVGDFRRLIDDPSIDAIVVGTPDHWHAIPTILACQADKDVYVEKPDGHNIVEGMRMVAAMRERQRIVQMGSQQRSTYRLQSALEFVHSGKLGRCTVAKAWESSKQPHLGHPPDGEPPQGVDYEMWIGPAPKRPFNPLRFHGNWRWFYDYGTGDLGNDGVHRLDMAVALLNAACQAQGDDPLGLPRTVFANGGKWYFDDAQEFPDTMQVNYQYEGVHPKLLTYELRIWAPYAYLGEKEGSAVFGDQGYLVMGNRRWIAFDNAGAVIAQDEGDGHEKPHVANFLECVKSRRMPYCDLETVGHPASLLCHTGNIAVRVGRMLTLDAATETFVDDPEANALRTRAEYRRPWVLP